MGPYRISCRDPSCAAGKRPTAGYPNGRMREVRWRRFESGGTAYFETCSQVVERWLRLAEEASVARLLEGRTGCNAHKNRAIKSIDDQEGFHEDDIQRVTGAAPPSRARWELDLTS
eukprot:CAMPEP_0119475972 /NCGR_PEP_ID=MMETSP1344-20130328/6673_1 /TAXON_ID=236787 /ORGANISM="Florenciella parvula, Strain CCMP2471" /LENGTH=115 /DNA_ID=CAMNT_0007509641 /DNA_START=195 /DNA_END=542 /DNA_ORIENTATION=+